MEEICKWTNKEAQGVFSNNWKDATVAELRKVIGTLLPVGVYKSSNKDLCQLWHMEHGRPIFVKLSRVITFKIYYVFFDSMTLQLDDLPDRQINFHLLEMYLKFGINLCWMHMFLDPI